MTRTVLYESTVICVDECLSNDDHFVLSLSLRCYLCCTGSSFYETDIVCHFLSYLLSYETQQRNENFIRGLEL